MALFFAEDSYQSGSKRGFDHYREILERDAASFILGGLITLAGFLPFGVGLFFAVGTSSLLVMLCAAGTGGLFAGPALYAFYDLLFRSLRDAPAHWWRDYQTAVRKNWRSALLPGVVLCLFIGIAVFMAMFLFGWSVSFTGWGDVAMFLLSWLLTTMLFTVYWPQLVLFQQSTRQRLKNCVLFCLKYFWHTLGVAAVQVGYWTLIAIFLPWSSLVLPVTGLWFVLFLANFLLYPDLNTSFKIEKAIQEQFPDQVIRQE